MFYFVYPTFYIHFVYHVLKIKEAHVLLYFKHMLNYIKRLYSLKMRIFYKDKETIIRLGNYFTAFIIKKGMLIKFFPPYIQV
jgi:hypothetical protein